MFYNIKRFLHCWLFIENFASSWSVCFAQYHHVCLCHYQSRGATLFWIFIYIVKWLNKIPGTRLLQLYHPTKIDVIRFRLTYSYRSQDNYMFDIFLGLPILFYSSTKSCYPKFGVHDSWDEAWLVWLILCNLSHFLNSFIAWFCSFLDSTNL